MIYFSIAHNSLVLADSSRVTLKLNDEENSGNCMEPNEVEGIVFRNQWMSLKKTLFGRGYFAVYTRLCSCVFPITHTARSPTDVIDEQG